MKIPQYQEADPQQAEVVRWFLILVSFLACLLSVLFLDLKAQALGFNTRDYPFYIQFAARLFDPELSNRFTLNPSGFNYLGYAGIEGQKSFHQSIHLELIRYLYPVAYSLTGKPISLFAFNVILYFLPLVYISWVFPVRRRWDAWFFLLIALLYICFPLTLSTIADDLRPRSLMVPAFTMTILSMHWQRPWFEKLIFFGLLLIIREESLLLAPGIIAYDFFRTRGLGRKNYLTLPLICISLGWMLVQWLYFRWTLYEISSDLTPFEVFDFFFEKMVWVVAAAGIIGILAFILRDWFRKVLAQNNLLPTLVYILLILPPFLAILILIIHEQKSWAGSLPSLIDFQSQVADLVFSPKNALLFAAILLLLLQISDLLGSESARKGLMVAVGVVLLLSAQASFSKAYKDVMEYRAAVPLTKILCDLRNITDPRTSHILTDYAVNQAFFDYENQYVYERLPAYIIPEDTRFYPENRPILMEIIKNQMEWVAIETRSKEEVLHLLQEAKKEYQVTAENSQFIVMRLR